MTLAGRLARRTLAQPRPRTHPRVAVPRAALSPLMTLDEWCVHEAHPGPLPDKLRRMSAMAHDASAVGRVAAAPLLVPLRDPLEPPRLTFDPHTLALLEALAASARLASLDADGVRAVLETTASETSPRVSATPGPSSPATADVLLFVLRHVDLAGYSAVCAYVAANLNRFRSMALAKVVQQAVVTGVRLEEGTVLGGFLETVGETHSEALANGSLPLVEVVFAAALRRGNVGQAAGYLETLVAAGVHPSEATVDAFVAAVGEQAVERFPAVLRSVMAGETIRVLLASATSVAELGKVVEMVEAAGRVAECRGAVVRRAVELAATTPAGRAQVVGVATRVRRGGALTEDEVAALASVDAAWAQAVAAQCA